MIHNNCGGVVSLQGDRYECAKCHVGWKCVGREEYLADVVRVYYTPNYTVFENCP